MKWRTPLEGPIGGRGIISCSRRGLEFAEGGQKTSESSNDAQGRSGEVPYYAVDLV